MFIKGIAELHFGFADFYGSLAQEMLQGVEVVLKTLVAMLLTELDRLYHMGHASRNIASPYQYDATCCRDKRAPLGRCREYFFGFCEVAERFLGLLQPAVVLGILNIDCAQTILP